MTLFGVQDSHFNRLRRVFRAKVDTPTVISSHFDDVVFRNFNKHSLAFNHVPGVLFGAKATVAQVGDGGKPMIDSDLMRCIVGATDSSAFRHGTIKQLAHHDLSVVGGPKGVCP